MIDTRNYFASDILRDGALVNVRAIRRDDRVALVDAFSALDPDSIYTRFFSHKKELTDFELKQLTDVDPNHVVALVVTDQGGQGERLVGGGRYCSEQPLSTSTCAELAFMTADGQHGRGIATLILKHLIRIGRGQGLAYFEADVLAQNQPMLGVFKRSGLTISQRQDVNVVHLRLSLVDNSA